MNNTFYNLETEQAIIGCILVDNNLLAKCDFTEDAFYGIGNREIWREIIEIKEKNNIVDATMLTDISEAVGIVSSYFVQSNFNIYKKRLLELQKKRELFKTIEDIRKEIEGSTDFTTALDIKAMILNRTNNIMIEKSTRKHTLTDAIFENSEILEKQYNGGEVYYNWGLKPLDIATGGVIPTYLILSARPSVGKTAFSLQLGKNVAQQGGKVAFFSLETARNQIVNRLVANEGNINKSNLDKASNVKDLDWTQYARTINKLHNYTFNIYDEAFDIETILLKAEEQRAEQGLDLLILDYLQLVESKRNFATQNEKVSYISRQLKKFQQQTGLTILALSQFSREAEKSSEPSLAHLRDSGSLEQDARVIMFLYEDAKNEKEQLEEFENNHKKIKFKIAKNSEGDNGLFKILKFYGATQRFYE